MVQGKVMRMSALVGLCGQGLRRQRGLRLRRMSGKVLVLLLLVLVLPVVPVRVLLVRRVARVLLVQMLVGPCPRFATRVGIWVGLGLCANGTACTLLQWRLYGACGCTESACRCSPARTALARRLPLLPGSPSCRSPAAGVPSFPVPHRHHRVLFGPHRRVRACPWCRCCGGFSSCIVPCCHSGSKVRHGRQDSRPCRGAVDAQALAGSGVGTEWLKKI